ncbi:PQQ-binding-like beta-propeller repeat protein [Streptomyces sp. NPDC016309]|uniref:outer membrane protein assembly factor BamB family protein n=1 Tax=Streptomyces sp. NPDC016309 TaxID=3364965 RepID=UPI003700B341
MTQPPPPPHQPPNQPPGQPPHQPPGQPPSGGFGAPQEPPSGGFGAPQEPAPGFGAPTPPPQDPAYGYPQAPQTPPPAQAPGYGYPQAPGPYPPSQGGQPGYGYPTAPAHQQLPPQQGSGGGRKLSAQMQIIIAAAVAVVLIIAGGVWYASAGGDDDPVDNAKGTSGGTGGGGDDGGKAAPDGPGKEKAPDNTQAKVAFQLPLPKVTDITDVSGSWVTDTAYVKSGIESVVGYDIAKGTPLWTTPLPGQVCAASRHVKDNKTAIAFEAAKRVPPKNFQPCTEVGVIDLATGKLLWRKSVTSPDSGDEKASFDEVTVGGGTVAAGGLDGGAAWDLVSGKELWRPQINAEECEDKGYAGGENLVAARACGPLDNQYLLIQNLDPKSGAPLSSYKMPPGVEDAGIVSTKPLVVAADVGRTAGDGSSISDFFSIDEKTGKLKTKIAAAGDRYAAECELEVEQCSKVVVGNNRLYLPTEDHEGGGEYGDTNEIVSFDLTTGKPTTDKAEAGDRYSMFPLRMDGGNIIAYKEAPYDKGGQVVSINGATFKQTVLLENPADKAVRDAESSFNLDSSEIRYADGRLFIADDLFDKPSSSSSDRKQYLAIAFSTH